MLLIEEGRTYCITTVCQKVTPTVLSIYFVEVANTKMKFSKQLLLLLGQVLIWVQSICFSQSDAPCTKKNCNYLQFSFFFFAEVRHTVKKFDVQIYHYNIKLKLCFGCDRAIFRGHKCFKTISCFLNSWLQDH